MDEWKISKKDGNPTNEGEYLTITKVNCVKGGRVQVGYVRSVLYYRPGIGFTLGTDIVSRKVDVDGWMELPEPPKGL